MATRAWASVVQMAIGRIEADPAEIGHEGFRPGVAGLLMHGAVGAQEVAGDVARRNAAAARAGDEDVGVVLADAALEREGFRRRGAWWWESSSNVICSLICTISACRKPSTSSSALAPRGRSRHRRIDSG